MATRSCIDDGQPLEPVVDVAARRGLSITPKTAGTWSRKGRAGVRLDAIKIRQQWRTTEAAMTRFLRAVAAVGAAGAP